MGKSLVFIVFGLLSAVVGCNDEDDTAKDPVDGTWNVINISGGFAGINDDYDQGMIIWSFNSVTSTLTVNNNNATNTLYDGLDSGEYPYTLLTVEKKLYLQINSQEFGGITIHLNEMTLDQNSLSTGSGADGFILVLAKQVSLLPYLV